MSDDDDDFIQVTAAQMYFIVSMLAVFSVFGSAGNAIVLYVFSAAKDDLVSTLFIIVLAVVDFSTCVFVIPFTIVYELVSYNIRFDVLCKFYQFLITSNIPFSALIMTAIAVDRYLCICHPFARLLTLRRARLVVCVLAAFAGALGVVGGLTHSVYHRPPQRAQGDVANSTDSVTIIIATSKSSASAIAETEIGEAVYTGQCGPAHLILNKRFALAFQKCYTSLFVVCLGVVVVLYALIYRSVLRQRQKRQRLRGGPVRLRGAPPSVQHTGGTLVPAADNQSPAAAAAAVHDSGLLTVPQRHNDRDESEACLEAAESACLHPTAVVADTVVDKTIGEKASTDTTAAAAEAESARRNRIANIKTAAMLFVVTVVFAVSFFPALAMTVKLLPFHMIIFYMYFANNVANPVIYSFMNNNFRKQLVRLFCK